MIGDSIISKATKQNWRRLGVLQNSNYNFISEEKLKNSTQSPKLVSRANKKLSQKNIVPVEYFCCVKNIAKIQTLIDLITAKHYNIADCLYSFALNLLAKKQILHRKHTQTVLKDFELRVHKDLLELDLPQVALQFTKKMNDTKCLNQAFTTRKISFSMP